MSDTATPAAAPDPTINADGIVYVIESHYHTTDRDNYPETIEQVLLDEGWFSDEASAGIRSEQLNERTRAFYNTSMASNKRSHDAKVRAAEKANKEAAAIRAAGMNKADVPVPPPFEPPSFERFLRSTDHTSYEVITVRRSDHDGIAQAISIEEVVAQVAEPEKPAGTRG